MITDPLVLVKHKKGYFYLMRGRETFYDENRHLISFDDVESAEAWAWENLDENITKIYMDDKDYKPKTYSH